MPTKEVLITIRLQIDTDEDVSVDVGPSSAVDEEDRAGEESAAIGVATSIEQFITDNAPPSLAGYQLEFLRRCVDELGLTAEVPATSVPRTYINLFPPKRYGAKRAGVIETRTGRADLHCSPEHAEGRRFAKKITNNDVAVAVKVYLKGAEAVNEAIDIARLVLAER